MSEEVRGAVPSRNPDRAYSSAFDERFAEGDSIDWWKLVDHTARIPAHYNLEQVQNFFRQNPDLKFSAVLENEEIVGLCSERRISRILSMRGGLGFAVYAKNQVLRHMDRNELRISRGTPVHEVLSRVMSRGDNFFDDVILTDEAGSYLGLINARSLMLLQHRINHLQLETLTRVTSELNVKNQELADKNIELAKARDIAVQAAESKSSFLANMSHEIRTPLNGILGMIKILMRTPLTVDQRRFATTVLHSANALLTILNDILDFSKIEAGKMTFESIDCDLSDMVEEVVQLLTERAREKKLELFAWVDPGVDTRIKSDPTRLRQVLLNLATNAIKFTERGEVVIRVSPVGEAASSCRIRVSVSDTGIGISKEAQERLFGAFEQADQSTSRRYGGTGLGLAISKRIVSLLGGKIGLESEPGKGSTFWFELEVEKQILEKTRSLVLEPETDFWGLRVLVVNESESFTSYIGHHLQRWNTVYRVAKTGTEAVEMVKRQATRGSYFEFVVLDYRLPDMNGLELARRLSELQLGSEPGLVLLTSFQEEVPAEKVREAGIVSLLTKPIKPTELRQTLLRARGEGLNYVEQKKVREVEISGQESEIEVPPLSILLVEDSPVNREVALLLLEGWNHRLETADNGVIALQKLREKTYDCVLMDCQMPEMDGYEATRAIRSGHSGVLDPGIRIVAMTANAMPGDRERCLQCGMNDYVGKPIEEKDLQSALWRAAESRKGGGSGKSEELSPGAGISEVSAEETFLETEEPYFPEKLVALFLTETAARIEDLKRTLKEGDLESASRFLHTIVGTSGNFKAKKLYFLGRQLEAKLKSGQKEGWDGEMAVLDGIFAEIRSKWEGLRKEPVVPVQEKPFENPEGNSEAGEGTFIEKTESGPDEEPYFPARLIQMFISETESRLVELKNQLEKQEGTDVARTLHTIKGTAGNFRAQRLFHVTYELENKVKEGNLAYALENMGRLEEAFGEARTRLLTQLN